MTGRYLPASIRDQMLRAHFAIDRLNRRQSIAGRSILVIGAGACGVTAAIEAARLGARVTVIDKSRSPFSLQRRISSRWLDPTQYDWPAEHWTHGHFPAADGAEVPLAWESGTAARLVIKWTQKFKAAQILYGENLKFWPSKEYKIIDLDSSDGLIGVEIANRDGTRFTQSFEYVLFYYGFGTEMTAIAEYVGISFWGEPLEHPAWTRVGSNILIVGGGDGALQDFLLVTTGRSSARDIYQLVIPLYLQSNIHRIIHTAEDQAARSSIWSDSTSYDHSVYRILEKAHIQVIEETLLNASVQDALDRIVIRHRHVTIAHKCDHFSRAYALNRFLTLLILARFKNSGTIVRALSTTIENVQSADPLHTCNQSTSCYGFPHVVGWRSASCTTAEGEISSSIFTGLIIRGGVKPLAKIQAKKAGVISDLEPVVPIRRQCLPFYPCT